MASLALTLVALAATHAGAYAVGPAVPLDDLAKSADLVCKATVVKTTPVTDAWFDKLVGYAAHETELKVVSVIKGRAALKVVRFRHYAPVPGAVGPYSPQYYELEAGRTYLVFAAKGPGGTFRQLDKSHTSKGDQGVIRTADAKRHSGKTIKEVVWVELQALLASTSDDDVIEGIRQLDEMSGKRHIDLTDFARKAALDAIRPKILTSSIPVATAAIGVFGADSPYFEDEHMPYWLAGVGKGTISGIGPLKPPASPAADLATKELLAVANGTTQLRALAIRALGRSRAIPAANLVAWTKDKDPAVRGAAVLASADRAAITAAATDAVPSLRQVAAFSIGFSQDPTLVGELGALLSDAVPEVRKAAAMSLLSFSIDHASPVMKAHLNSDYRSLFVNVLARRDPAPYLAQLAEVIEKNLYPSQWWGGRTPAGDSWELLYDYVKARPVADLATGKLDRWLDALERMKWFSSSEPRKLYALYLVRTLHTRATRFRADMKKATTYNIDYYFDMADKDPAHYF